jgi:hypothetical protein
MVKEMERMNNPINILAKFFFREFLIIKYEIKTPRRTPSTITMEIKSLIMGAFIELNLMQFYLTTVLCLN